MAKRNNGLTVNQAVHLPTDATLRELLDGAAMSKVYSHNGAAPSDPACVIKQLPSRLLFRAAEVATMVNPVNAPFAGFKAVAGITPPTPLAIAVSTAKYWGPEPRKLTVSFMDSPAGELRARILSHMNAWTRTGCVEFVETEGVGQVRIARGPSGYWSYLGTDILQIPANLPTMNLQSFTMQTSEAEYRRVVRHETGHTLGMPHEHMRRALVERIDQERAYEYFRTRFGWDRQMVDQQVLTPLDEATLMFTPADQDSIMCYQLPGSITRDGQPIRGGLDVNESDFAFVGRIYPRGASAKPAILLAADRGLGYEPEVEAQDKEWPETQDVVELRL